MYALHDPSTPPPPPSWIRRFTIFTDLVERDLVQRGGVKLQYRKVQAERGSLAQPPPDLGMALVRTVLSIFSREKTASTCMQLLTCTRTNPARNDLSCNREYRRLRAFPIWGIHIQTKSTFICGINGVGGGGGGPCNRQRDRDWDRDAFRRRRQIIQQFTI